jgi:predicted ABC-type transport system involved in lysophospholipase L1 biosynthesis ATPase subunit
LIIVTHDSSVARRAQRIGVMKEGKLAVELKARSPVP